MKSTITIGMIVFMTFSLPACKQKDDPCVAGQGGGVTIVAFPQHHGKAVRPYAAWVKYNTRDAPGFTASSYDLVKQADTTEDHIELTNLKCGNYYLYLTGYDTSGKEAVKGGIPYTIPEGASGEININVPVTE